MDLFFVGLAFHRVTKIDWFPSGSSDDFLSQDFATSTIKGYPTERLAPVDRQKVNDDRVVFELVPAVDVNWLSGVARKSSTMLSVNSGGTVVLLMVVRAYQLMFQPILLTTIMIYFRKKRLGMVRRDLLLRQMNVPLSA